MDHTRLLADLVAIDSVNPALVPGAAGEAEIAAYVTGWLRERSLDVTVLDEPCGRPSVVGVARGTGGGAALMLNAHVDTVGVAGMRRPHDPEIRDGRLYGRGAFDMKGGLAAIMLAGGAAAGAGLRGDVVVTAVADEEHASAGVQAVLRRWSADACVVTEPTQLRACVAHKGFVWAELQTRGRAAHGSRPDLGVDAIAGMGPVLAGIHSLQERLDSAPHPLLGPASLHASLVDVGQELSSYPERCVLGLERRTLPGERATDVERELAALLALARDADPRLETELRIGLWRTRSRSIRRRRSSACCGPRVRRCSAPSRRSSATTRGWTRRSRPLPGSRPSSSVRRRGSARDAGIRRPRKRRALCRGPRRDGAALLRLSYSVARTGSSRSTRLTPAADTSSSSRGTRPAWQRYCDGCLRYMSSQT